MYYQIANANTYNAKDFNLLSVLFKINEVKIYKNINVFKGEGQPLNI